MMSNGLSLNPNAHTSPILLVDDQPQNLAALQQVLSAEYRLVFARNGADAIATALKHIPALILLDIEMPDMDGYAVCRALKADSRTEAIPVIFVTSLGEVGDEAAGFAVGAVDYITKPFSPAIVSARVRTHLSLVRTTLLEHSYRDAIFMLGTAGHYNDVDTGMHIWRMAAYSAEIAAACGWSAEACHQLELAAPMHDTGKIGIPDAILRKPAELDAVEWGIMKTHSIIGHDILSKSEAPIFQMAAEIALCHHERFDGSGYPNGLVGEEIPESARIVALADVFDALSMQRPYKDAWSLDSIMANLHAGSGKHFEPRLVEIFVSILPRILEIKAEWEACESWKK
ncbi:MAG TPA: HD domain-containing phosphohydrolase [Herbaspirillum sp.]|jgi:putative two-component system response regulator|nr:HD domain-containing phosphohydrolase [Herbaspirillum sp.]